MNNKLNRTTQPSPKGGWIVPGLIIFGAIVFAGFLAAERPPGGTLLAIAVAGGAIALLAMRDWQNKVFAPIGVKEPTKRYVVLGVTIMFMLVTLGSSDTENADALWAEGRKSEAVQLYIAILDGPAAYEPEVLKRVIEYYFENGNEDQTRHYCNMAIEAEKTLILEPAELRNLFDSLVAEKKKTEELAQIKQAEEQKQAEAAAKTEDNKVTAWVMATEFIEARLKSPSTASYGGLLSGDYQNPEEHVTVLGENLYLVTGWVDSQNSFGATVRSKFKVKIQNMGDDKWKLIEEPTIKTRM